MPAAAVIPAPVAYAIVAVAKRLAVVYPYGLLGCVPLCRANTLHPCGVVYYSFGLSPLSVLSRTCWDSRSQGGITPSGAQLLE